MTLFKKTILYLGFLGCLSLFSQCTEQQNTLKEGTWRASLQREDGQEITFNFNLKDSSGHKIIYITNAEERLRVDSIQIENDSIFIQMPFFGSHFEAEITSVGSLNGSWIREYGSKKVSLDFHATSGDTIRIPAYTEAQGDLSGTWEAVFGNGDRQTKAIGLFHQKENRVTGTFLTPVGDYRYLQGVLSGDTLKLSGFDGCHALLFTALLDSSKQSLTQGKVFSLNREARSWTADKKDYDSLPDSYAVENIPPGTVKSDFTLKDFQTQTDVSIHDSAYKNKVVVIQILGSWCPNCMDETGYLTQYYNENKDRGVEVIGVAFERSDDFDESKKALNSFFNHFDINYPVLYSGTSVSDPDKTAKVFPNLPTKIHAYPTTIFVDKEGYVRKTHSGYNGPATGKYYEEYKKEFEGIVNGLVEE